MGKTVIKVSCIDQRLTKQNYPILASGGKNEDEIEFSFCPLWDGFEKAATFRLNDGEAYHAVVSENRCIIPHEVLADAGWIEFGVFGVKDGITRTSENLKYRVVKGAITEDTKPSDPTPELYEQYMERVVHVEERVTNIENGGGGGGNLPPVTEKDNEKVLTVVEGEWAAKEPAGGNDGISCTHSWNGTTLTVTSASGTSSANLKGEKGDKGDDGDDGYTPVKGTDYWTEADKQEMVNEVADQINAVQYVPQELTEEQKAQARKNIGAAEASGLEPAEDDIPKVFFFGTAPTSKAEDELPLIMEYRSKTLSFKDYVTLKVQGDSSSTYPKKNFNLKMFTDEERTQKDKRTFRNWSNTNKYCLKANWIDITHARNIVNGRLWGQVVRSRADYADYPIEYRESTNCGAVDGFPVKLYLNGVYQGRYTWNIRKDESMWNMDDSLGTQAALIADAGNNVTCWKSLPNIDGSDWTDELNDVVPDAVRTSFRNLYSFVMNSTDEEFKANVNDNFYLSSLIDYFVFIYTILMAGGLFKSQTMLTYDTQKWFANIYDMDTTWALRHYGSDFYSYTLPCPSGYEGYNSGYSNLLYDKLIRLFPDEIKARYSELRANILSDANIINEFERFTDIAPPYLVAEDYAETTAGGLFVNIPSKTTNNIQKLRDIIVTRLKYCDDMIPKLGVEYEAIEWIAKAILSSGELSDSTIRISTLEFIPDNVTEISVAGDYSVSVFPYTYVGDKTVYDFKNGFVDYVDGVPSTLGTSNVYQKQHNMKALRRFGSHFKLNLRKDNNSDISISESSAVSFSYVDDVPICWMVSSIQSGIEQVGSVDTRLLTSLHLPDNISSFVVADGYKAGCVCYNSDGEYCGFWNYGSNSIGGLSWEQSADISIPRAAGYDRIRIMMKRDDGANITIEEGANVTFS